MKTKFRLMFGISLILLAGTINAAAQKDFESFWKNFKAAVIKNDKNAVAALSQFPISMPYGIKEIKTRAQFIKRYAEIFNGDADAVECFPNAELIKGEGKYYAAYCAFKGAPKDTDDKPLKYIFEITKTGWKFVGFDNINE